MLNPSTADESIDDRTITRCIGFTSRWGYSGLIVINLCALRSTNPLGLRSAKDPIGPENDCHIQFALLAAGANDWPVIAAWGMHGSPSRVSAVASLANAVGVGMQCLGVTRSGQPRHPLYVPYRTQLRPWDQDQQAVV